MPRRPVAAIPAPFIDMKINYDDSIRFGNRTHFTAVIGDEQDMALLGSTPPRAKIGIPGVNPNPCQNWHSRGQPQPVPKPEGITSHSGGAKYSKARTRAGPKA
jgi:hypothetical protein